MELRHLEYVLEVARLRNVTQAAASLGVAQPAVSQAISSLERHFGVTIFDRTSRPIQPTPAGLKIIEVVSRVLAEMKNLQSVADAHASLLRGRLTIGTNYWVGVTLLPALLVEFHKLYPGITFRGSRASGAGDSARAETRKGHDDDPERSQRTQQRYSPVRAIRPRTVRRRHRKG
jgi:DNA-binding transcriptional LysR family regulator